MFGNIKMDKATLARLYVARERLARFALAPSSRVKYDNTWRAFEAFCASIGKSPTTKVSVDALELYVSWRYEIERVCADTVRANISSIKTVAAEKRIRWPSESKRALLSRMLKGFTRQSGPTKHKVLVTLPELEHAVRACKPRSAYETCMRDAAWAVAFWAMLRPGDYAVRASRDQPSALLENVSIVWTERGALDKVCIALTKSKMDQSGENSHVMVDCKCKSADGAIHLCGAHRMLDYLALRKRISLRGPLFLREDGRVLTQATLASWIAAVPLSVWVGEVPPTPHSWRAGGATHWFLAGVALEFVETIGRWARGSRALRTAYLLCTHAEVLDRASDSYST